MLESQIVIEEDDKVFKHLPSPVSMNSQSNTFLIQYDRDTWLKLCFEERVAGLSIQPEIEELIAHHTGTPPLMSIVTNLSDNSVNCLITYQIDVGVFVSTGV